MSNYITGASIDAQITELERQIQNLKNQQFSDWCNRNYGQFPGLSQAQNQFNQSQSEYFGHGNKPD